MENGYVKYFLGANSCEGFVSHFGDCYDPADGWRVYIIKGGPGTGKSSFMKFMAKRAHDDGLSVELCACSSDPQSLDGVIIPEIKTVFLDGTAPHIVEPRLVGACEEIINLGEFWDSDALKERAGDILETTRHNTMLHKTASGYLKATGHLMLENLKYAAACTDTDRVLAFANSLCKRKIPFKKRPQGREWCRFIGAVTPMGVVAYSSTPLSLCGERVIISDRYSSVSGRIMQAVRDYALCAGYEIITVENPFMPSKLIDHVIIPELSLCFLTENDYISFDCPERRIHARRFVDGSLMREKRARMRFCERTAKELVIGACETLAAAKRVHDRLEKYYVDAMDFSALSLYAEAISEKL